MEFPVKTRQDLQRFRWLYGDVRVEPDDEAMAAARARCRQVGELAACPDHRRIALTTAGVAPPACRAETFREIGRWLRTVPVRL